ncbi:DUF485 domain-containing protein [Ornithinibacillus halotolerans]|uniref:Membrane protein n=1 Tax=Ornithinibacillus halotolerans TaxID=1274357 RepID=A0A916SCB5_9BACI|nr:DUF485 domain-containing protein [Ornithinibacillus halotolerans]GGA92970.1 membrane protein [Ornithinibacillus halotolerans]
MAQPKLSEENKKADVDFEKVLESSQFKKLMQNKKKFIVPLTIFFLIFYFLLPISTSYGTFLNKPFIGDITWAWVYAISQFIMVWTICTIYVKKASSFDKEADDIINDQIGKGGSA